MEPVVHFQCRNCGEEISFVPSGAGQIPCPRCKAEVMLFLNESLVKEKIVTTCVSCGHDTLYVQKDFNRNLGMVIVGIGIAASVYFFAKSQPLWAMGSLGATAVIDFLAYALVGEVTVCYSCHAVYRGFRRNTGHEPFDLKKLEKYGGRTPRGSL